MIAKKFIVLLLLASGVAFGWPASDPPEGHIESSTIPDGKLYTSVTEAITSLIGTAHKGGANPNAKINNYLVYKIKDRNGDGQVDSDDEPYGSTSLSAGIDDAVTTLPVTSAAWFGTPGTVTIGTELVYYADKTAVTLTGCVRGYLETTAATHNSGDAVQKVNSLIEVLDATVDGSPYNAVGYDASYGQDDGTEGELLQGVADDIAVTKGESWLLILRVVDAVGGTNWETGGGVDTFVSHGANIYVDQDGAASEGTPSMADVLEDDEVVWVRINKKPL